MNGTLLISCVLHLHMLASLASFKRVLSVSGRREKRDFLFSSFLQG